MRFIELLFKLLIWHAVADYALQPESMIRRKNPTYAQEERYGPWWWTMTAHSLINAAGVVYLCAPWIGLCEAAVHFAADYLKCHKDISANVDQAIHIVSKVLWAYLTWRFYG